jgi:hypothetical protein
MWMIAIVPTTDPLSDDNSYVGLFKTREEAQEFIDSAYDDADELYATDEPIPFHLSTDDVEFAHILYINVIGDENAAV